MSQPVAALRAAMADRGAALEWLRVGYGSVSVLTQNPSGTAKLWRYDRGGILLPTIASIGLLVYGACLLVMLYLMENRDF